MMSELSNSWVFNNNTQDGADPDQEDAKQYVIPEFSEEKSLHCLLCPSAPLGYKAYR